MTNRLLKIIDQSRCFHSFQKILIFVVANYVLNFLDEHSILYAHQYVFRRGHSTSHAIISFVEKVSHSLDTGKIVVGVFLDLKKAFGTVDHQILLINYMHMEYEIICMNGLKATSQIDHNM